MATLPDTIKDPFPRDEQGQLVQTDAVMNEGDRIRANLANGTYGRGAAAAQSGTPQVTVAPASPLIEGNFGASGSDWSQADWGKSQYDLEQEANLDNLRATAEARKIANETAVRDRPLQEQLLSARASAAGAHTRFLQGKDLQTLRHTTNFFNDLSHPDAPTPGSPDYTRYVSASLARNPEFAVTHGGQSILQALAKGQEAHTSIEELANKVGPGLEITGGEVGTGKQNVLRFAPKGVGVAKELKTYGLTQAHIDHPVALQVGKMSSTGGFSGDDNGDFIRMKGPKGGWITMPTSEYERFGGTYSPDTTAKRSGQAPAAVAGAQPAAAPAVKHLGVYDPKTNEFK